MHHEDNFTSHGEMATSSAVQFHPFRRLPLELRKKIWALTSPGPCAVFSGEHECTRKEPELDRNTFLAVIHTSREARSQFLEGASNISASKNRVYQKYQVCQFAPSFKNVFFDFQRDTLVYMSAKDLDLDPNNNNLDGQTSQPLEDRMVDQHYVKYLAVDLDEFLMPNSNSDSGSDSGSDLDSDLDRDQGQAPDQDGGPDSDLNLDIDQDQALDQDGVPDSDSNLDLEPYQASNQGGDSGYEYEANFNVFPELFPSLERITLFYDVLAPLDPSQTKSELRRLFELLKPSTDIENMVEAKRLFYDAKTRHPEWNAPVLVFAETEYFMDNPLGKFEEARDILPPDTRAVGIR